ncbi:MAG: SCO family protein [Pseudomonadota bacterium]
MPQSPFARALLSLGLGVAVLALGLAAWLYTQPQESGGFIVGEVSVSGAAQVGGPFVLVDQAGATRSEKDFSGKFMLVYFGYTYCPDFCPTSLSVMTQALDQLAERDPAVAAQVVPVFITVDPDRDTVEAMAAYAPNFHERLVALTGSAEQIADAAGAYRVYYAKVEDDSATEYLMDHTTFIYLMDRDGAYATHFATNSPPAKIAETIEQWAER